jgi:hypothetical protein
MSFLLQQVLHDPQRVLELDNKQLELLLSQARTTRLLASLALELRNSGLDAQLSKNVSRHFESGIRVHEKQKRDLLYDAEQIKRALDSIGEKLVLLKGAAYLLGELPVGQGRLITDIDIIVPRQRINTAEQAFTDCGWETHYTNTYNDRYYRQWGHEIPPLTNKKRGSTLDVHHNILPPTARPNINAALFYDDLIEVKPGIFTLSRRDMVIHSATHLFHEGEFHHGLRDLWDLNRMLRDFPNRETNFWDGLVARSRELELDGSLFHGLNYVNQLFATPVPQKALKKTGNRARRLRKPVMDFLFRRAFRPDHPDCRLPFTGHALSLLYMRSHYLRMPLYLLIPHLARKAWMRQFGEKAPTPDPHETGDT